MRGGPNKARQPKLLIDSREQKPYRLPNSVVAALSEGDYALAEVPRGCIAVERKEKADIWNCVAGDNRLRFVRELERLQAYKYPAIVIESSLPEFLQPPRYSQLNPQSVIQSLIAWSVRYRMPIWFAGDRAHGQALTRSLLEKFWVELNKTE